MDLMTKNKIFLLVWIILNKLKHQSLFNKILTIQILITKFIYTGYKLKINNNR
jgi:hypothetical protein